MQVGVLSDIHDQLENLDRALDILGWKGDPSLYLWDTGENEGRFVQS